MPRPMRSLKLSHLERALIRKLYARHYSTTKLRLIFCCGHAPVSRTVHNHMNDNIDDDDMIIRNSDLSADIAATLGLKERDDGRAFTTINAGDGRRPLAPTRGVIPQMPAPRSVPRTVTRSSPTTSVEATGGDSNPHTVAGGVESDVGSALLAWEKPAPDSLASVERFLASIRLGEDHAQMLLDEGIKTHQDLIHIKRIIGTESLSLVKESLKSRGFTTFELLRFISAVKGIPA